MLNIIEFFKTLLLRSAPHLLAHYNSLTPQQKSSVWLTLRQSASKFTRRF